MFCTIHDFTFLLAHKDLRTSLFWVFRKKETFVCAIFDKICYIACVINRADKLIYLRACLHERDCTGFIDKPLRDWKIGK